MTRSGTRSAGARFELHWQFFAGQPQPGPLDSYVWLDRGIYRPGETVQVMALLRDNAGAPADIPARITVRHDILYPCPHAGGDGERGESERTDDATVDPRNEQNTGWRGHDCLQLVATGRRVR